MDNTQTVKELATKNVEHLLAKDSVKLAVDIILEKRIHNIVIKEDDESYSVLSISELMDIVIDKSGYEKQIATLTRKKLHTINENSTITEAISSLGKSNDILGVLDAHNMISSVLTVTDVMQQIEKKDLSNLSDITIGKILRKDSTGTAVLGEKLKNKVYQLKNSIIDCIIVLDGSKAKGIITNRDILRLSKEHEQLDGNVEMYMSHPLLTINANATVISALDMMQTKHYRRAIVIDSNSIFQGIITQKALTGYIYSQLSRKWSQELETVNDLLVKAVNERTKDIEAYKKNLEKIVEERTLELRKLNLELKEEMQRRETTELSLKFREEELQKLNMQLSNRVDEQVEINRRKDVTLFNQSKMAAMGELISMIAHQWRQPLSDLALQVTSLKFKIGMDTLDKSKLEHKLNTMTKVIQHMSATIDDFRNFYKPNKTRESIFLYEILNNSISILMSIILQNNINIVVENDDTIPIYSYKNELIQVCINLMQNSIDVLLEKKISKPKIYIKSMNIDEKYGAIVIRDNGGGIASEIVENIFSPYFTTKDEHNGTGLGLYMSKIIVEDHCKGEIDVRNHKNGAEFTIKLPI